jgi:hypothetical protein
MRAGVLLARIILAASDRSNAIKWPDSSTTAMRIGASISGDFCSAPCRSGQLHRSGQLQQCGATQYHASPEPGPLIYLVVEPHSLALPPHITLALSEGFALAMSKEVLLDHSADVADTILANPRLRP